MRLIDTQLVKEAWQDLRAHRGRTVLSAISLLIGVIAVVGVFTAGSVVRDVFVAGAEQQNGRAVTVETRIQDPAVAARGLPAVVADLDRRISDAGGSFALSTDLSGSLTTPDGTAHGQDVTLVAGRLDLVRRMPVLEGGWLPADSRVHPGGVVLNQAAAAQYGQPGATLLVGLDHRFQAFPQRVLGVVADGRQTPMVYLSLLSADAFQPGAVPADPSLDLLAHDPVADEAVLHDAVAQVGSDLGIPASALDIRRTDTVQQLADSLRTTQAAFLAAAVVTLLASVMGLLNIGLATVRDRRRELTIRRATGATRLRIFSLVLSSSLLVGLLAALVAIGAALLVVFGVVPHLLSPASAVEAPGFPVSAAAAGLLAALAASACGGIAPALAASRVDLAYALRE
ncbi:ABC transporter permease [Streptacidiphilus sp. N1-12]|uniref:ABC transporter permease n=2 Tax=Streptacidiphilus alkalitolerans TaxID=3342712 RepID=A0ABV6WE34_9ACTN